MRGWIRREKEIGKRQWDGWEREEEKCFQSFDLNQRLD